MKLNINKIMIIAAAVLVLIVLLVIFYIRPPVLIVTEESFLSLYSKKRVAREASITGFSLFRQVKTVAVANDAGFDIVPVAVLDVSSKPYCVIFPLRFARSAKLFNDQHPEITVIILEGRYQDFEKPVETAINSDISNFFIYKTDINDDFYMAGRASVVLDQGKSGSVIVFNDRNMPSARENFLRGLHDRGNLLDTRFYTSFSQYSESPNLSCAVVSGSGSELFEKRLGVPVILFSWIDPAILPADVILVIDDSPWVQAGQAVKLSSSGQKNGYIKSKFHYLDRKKLDKSLLR